MAHPPGRGDPGVDHLGGQDGPGPAGPAGDVGRHGGGERRVGLLEAQQPGGEFAGLRVGEPGADRAEVVQPAGAWRAGQDRSRYGERLPARRLLGMPATW